MEQKTLKHTMNLQGDILFAEWPPEDKYWGVKIY
jgi:hypothetical protein